ncbi:MAG: hypothetical protein ILP17_07525 [Lachnospiraceae bacterium]|nr:hypothetical protein [Lachnospiraceae bacterium]
MQSRSDEFSILNPGSREFVPLESVPFYQDLNLDQVIDRMSLRWGRDMKKYYRYLPSSPDEVSYRRMVYGDIRKEEVYSSLIKFTEDLDAVGKLRLEKEKARIPMQKCVWHIREIGAYCSAYEALEKSLDGAGLASEGMQEFHRILKGILESGGYRQLRERIDRIMEQIRKMRFIITYDKDRISVEPGTLEGEGAYEEMLKEKIGKEIRHLQNPFIADPTLTELENSCLEILEKKQPKFFAEIKAASDQSSGYERPVLRRFEREIIFYLSFCTLQRDMENAGYTFSTPTASAEKRMEAKGLYDLALAMNCMSSGEEIVSNDMCYEKGERFFVLTGPNQGGKTTFARSLGQLVYLSLMGLDVPAESANVPFFPALQTHFSVEESVETGRGKLKEELVRLAPMMADHQKGTFVVINELFTTAASYDAEIMGKNVLEHFTRLGCMGIYVTHLRELTTIRDGVVSLRAVLGDDNIPTFKIVRGEADDSACAESVVNKYRLTYSQLKERL